MSHILQSLIQALSPAFSSLFKSRQTLEDEYLAQAVDSCDLERRMRNIDHRQRAFGLGM